MIQACSNAFAHACQVLEEAQRQVAGSHAVLHDIQDSDRHLQLINGALSDSCTVWDRHTTWNKREHQAGWGGEGGVQGKEGCTSCMACQTSSARSGACLAQNVSRAVYTKAVAGSQAL